MILSDNFQVDCDQVDFQINLIYTKVIPFPMTLDVVKFDFKIDGETFISEI